MQMGLVYYPSKVLFTPGVPVTDFDTSLKQLAAKMFDVMYLAKGVGLAAQQVGLAMRFFVMDCSYENSSVGKVAIANPRIIRAEGTQEGYEGCLSLPGYSYKLQRAKRVIVEGEDLDGNTFQYEGRDLEARCILHETDHCDGVLYISRLSTLKRDQVIQSINKKMKANEWY